MIRPWEALLQARIYDLSRPLESSTPTSPNHPTFRMALLRRHGDTVRADGGSGANEIIIMGGHTGTHIDALSHVSRNMKLFGGIAADEASRGGRFQTLGVETIQPIVARGLLLDMPRVLGLDSLPAAMAISGHDLERACSELKCDVRKGDVVLIRTGWPIGRYSDPAAYAGWTSGVPGPDVSAANWLARRGVRATGADTLAYECLAHGAGHTQLPVHSALLVESGIPIIEALQLEDLAKDQVVDFLFILTPLNLVGATGSPVRPLALVQ